MARSLAALLICAAVATPARAGVEDVMRYEEVTLKNGLRVLLMPDRRLPRVAVVTWVRVGSADEVRGLTGLAHLFEHLMFKGSPNVPEGLIDRLAEEAGGSTNAYTTSDSTIFVDVAASTMLERFLWIEGDRLARLDAAIDKPKLDNQRDVVLNERREHYENLPYGMAEILLGEATWPEGHPYRAPTVGYVDDLRRATLEDAQAFFRRHYTPANAIMAIGGDFDPADARRWIARYLDELPAAPRPEAAKVPDVGPLTARKEISAADAVQVPRVYLRWRAPAAQAPEQPAIDLAAIILAGSKASRLYQKLVVAERVAQDVYAGYDAQVRAGELTLRVTVKPGVDVARVRELLDRELELLSQKPVSDAELERAKNVREADFLRAISDVEERTVQLLHYAVFAGDPGYLAKDLARYRAVTPHDLQAAVARWVRPDSAVVLTISPRSAAGAH